MFFITLSHVVPTITNSEFQIIDINALYWSDFLFRFMGQIGDALFITISFNFLCKSNKFKLKNVLSIIFDSALIVWISIAVICIYDLQNGTNLKPDGFIGWLRALFPVTSETYWFLAPYCIIYCFHPLLNKALNSISKKTHFILSTFSLIYIGFTMKLFSLYPNAIVCLVAIYIIINYINKYPFKQENSFLFNIVVIIASLGAMVTIVYVWHILKDPKDFYNTWSMIFNSWSSVFIIFAAISLINIFKQIEIKSKLITTIAKSSLLNYVLLNNIYFITLFNLYIYDRWLIPTYGVQPFLLYWIIAATCYFIIGLPVITLYSLSISKLIKKISEKIANLCTKLFNKFWSKINKAKEVN